MKFNSAKDWQDRWLEQMTDIPLREQVEGWLVVIAPVAIIVALIIWLI